MTFKTNMVKTVSLNIICETNACFYNPCHPVTKQHFKFMSCHAWYMLSTYHDLCAKIWLWTIFSSNTDIMFLQDYTSTCTCTGLCWQNNFNAHKWKNIEQKIKVLKAMKLFCTRKELQNNARKIIRPVHFV